MEKINEKGTPKTIAICPHCMIDGLKNTLIPSLEILVFIFFDSSLCTHLCAGFPLKLAKKKTSVDWNWYSLNYISLMIICQFMLLLSRGESTPYSDI